MTLSELEKAYVAGFLDGDGSIHVRIKPNHDYRFRFQIAPNIVFYQSQKEMHHLQWLNRLLGAGYVRRRNDGIAELVIGDEKGLVKIIKDLLPYLKLKQRQAKLMFDILQRKRTVKNARDFLKISRLIDQFEIFNYSKIRKQNADKVHKVLIQEGLLTP